MQSSQLCRHLARAARRMLQRKRALQRAALKRVVGLRTWQSGQAAQGRRVTVVVQSTTWLSFASMQSTPQGSRRDSEWKLPRGSFWHAADAGLCMLVSLYTGLDGRPHTGEMPSMCAFFGFFFLCVPNLGCLLRFYWPFWVQTLVPNCSAILG